jgi:hypothetical protein
VNWVRIAPSFAADPQQPYTGAPVAIGSGPVTVQAEDFDTGGEGVAYHDTTSGNDGNVYRPAEGVDLRPTADAGGGYRTASPKAGEWLEYTVDVATAGLYDLAFRVAASGTGGRFHVEVDGRDVTGSLGVPDTGGYDAFTTVTRAGVPLPAGRHVLRVALDVNATSGWAPGLNWFRVAPATTGPEAATVPVTTAAYVRDGSAYRGANFGGAADLWVKRNASASLNREAYLKVDLTRLDTIASATLRLFGALTDARDAGVTVNVHAASSTGWTESGLTWADRPAAGSTVRGSATVSGTAGRWYEVDLTSFLRAEQGAGRDVVTLVLRSPTNTDAAAVFHSDDATSNRPELVVTA